MSDKITHNKWKESEIEIIKQYYTIYDDKELTKLIPRHSETSIATKRKDLGFNRKSLNKKYSFADFKRLAESKGYSVISDETEYKNAGTILKYICPIHGIQETTLGRLLEGKGCNKCGYITTSNKRRQPFNEEQNKQLCLNNDCEYIKTKRVKQENVNVICVDFICNKHSEYGVQTIRLGNLKKGVKICKYCNRKHLPKEYIIEELNTIAPHIEILDNNFTKINDRVHCVCKKHNYENYVRVGDILKGGGCLYCGYEKTRLSSFLSDDEVRERLKNINPNLVMLDKYNGVVSHNMFKCQKCGHIWESSLSTVNFCPHCEKYYKGELAIENFLQTNNIIYESQKRFIDCIDKRPLSFDFYVPQYNTCIEYQGIQHYKPVERFGGEEQFIIQQKHDMIKKEYCAKNDINLIEIPYWYNTDDKISEFLKSNL